LPPPAYNAGLDATEAGSRFSGATRIATMTAMKRLQRRAAKE